MGSLVEVALIYFLAGLTLLSLLAFPLYKIRKPIYWIIWIGFCLIAPFLALLPVDLLAKILPDGMAFIGIFFPYIVMIIVISKFKKSEVLDEGQSKLAINFLCLSLALIPVQAFLYTAIFNMGLAAYVIFLLGVSIPAAVVLRVILMFMK